MFDFEDILSRLLRGNVSPTELASLSSFFQIENFDEADDSRKKYLVQRDVLKQLLREKIDDEELLELLKETEGWLLIRRRDDGYSCSYIGCTFKTSRHWGYVNHLKSSHFFSDNILCNFGHTCKRRFSSFPDLLDHVNSEHSKTTSSNTDQQEPSGNIVSRLLFIFGRKGDWLVNSSNFQGTFSYIYDDQKVLLWVPKPGVSRLRPPRRSKS